MLDTSPPILSNWSGPAAPECCLANKSPARQSSERLQALLETKIQQRLTGRGSMIYRTASKAHVTPLGRKIIRRRTSALRTSVSALSSEPLILKGWPTSTSCDSNRKPAMDFVTPNITLNHAAILSGWPTATTRDGKGGYVGGRIRNGKISVDTLDVAAQLVILGRNSNGWSAEMIATAQLNPRFSAWLMGYPPSWCIAALTCQLPRRSHRNKRTTSELPAA